MVKKWDARYLALATHVQNWSRDTSTKVGAVLVGVDKRKVSLGVNGPPPGMNDDYLYSLSRRKRLQFTLHAERNALDNAHWDTNGGTLYVTHPPCCDCAKSIASKGVSRVVCLRPNHDFATRWRASISAGLFVLKAAGIKLEEHRK
jgi:dCMP deaminase